jgi:hypothetical protein
MVTSFITVSDIIRLTRIRAVIMMGGNISMMASFVDRLSLSRGIPQPQPLCPTHLPPQGVHTYISTHLRPFLARYHGTQSFILFRPCPPHSSCRLSTRASLWAEWAEFLGHACVEAKHVRDTHIDIDSD